MNLEYFDCPLLDFWPLTPEGVGKYTFHVEIGWKGPAYRSGDSVAILAPNKKDLVDKVLNHFDHPDAEFRKELEIGWTITKSTHKLLRYLSENSSSQANHDHLTELLLSKERTKEFLEKHHVIDILEHFKARLKKEDVAKLFTPLLPRFYSIASSPLVSPCKVALTVAHVNYHQVSERFGVCSHHLLELGKRGQGSLRMALHPTRDFLLHSHDTDIIMVGPGTGIAPFRAFMQERLHKNSQARHWLFFGERYKSCYFYEDLWQACEKQLNFRIDCAFSRETGQKTYVQHKIQEKSSEIAQWLENATFYICGDAKNMARDVEKTLQAVLEQELKVSSEIAREKIKQMRRTGRYLSDVY